MIFFQLMLFAGYFYSHLIVEKLSTKWQALAQLGVVCFSLLFLPITPAAAWKPLGGEMPTLYILSLLGVSIGLPYFVLSSTSPLLQAWFSASLGKASNETMSPYRLFALSNFASFLALLSYPFFFESVFDLDSQAKIWSVSYCMPH